MASNVTEISVVDLYSNVSTNVQEALADIIGSKTDVSAAFVDSFSSTVFTNLKVSNPDILVIDQIGSDASKTAKIDLSRLGTTLKGEMSAIIFDSDQAVSLKGLSGFAGVISLSDANNTVSGGNNSQTVTIVTGAGNDSVTTGGGSDTISVGGGRDTINTGSGADTISFDGYVTGGKINTGSGNDVIDLSHNVGSDTVITISGGSGTDTLDLSELSIASVSKVKSTVTITLTDGGQILASNIEKFVYTDTNDVVQIVGVKLFDAEF